MGNPVLFGTLAIFALIYFYGIYFVKMAAQRKKGITTNQIGRRKEKGLHRVELFMSAATGLIVPIQLLSIVCNANSMPQIGRIIGFILALVGDTVFLISVLCMRDSWRTGIPESDKTEMVTGGIYSVSRNPAFLGFDLMYIGIFFMYCNLLTGIFTAFAILMLHLQILQEEKFLKVTFGADYTDYQSRVNRYLGRKNK